MRLCTNPYTGDLIDLDAVPVGVGGAKFCAKTGKPLNMAAVERYSYPGPAADREAWARDAAATVKKLEQQANEPNNVTLGMASGFTAPAAS